MKIVKLGLLAMLLSGAAWAEENSSPDSAGYAQKGACRQDIVTLCPGVMPGQGRLATCLAMNRDKVSPECRETIVTTAQNVRNGPCKADMQKFCSVVQPGQGRMRTCLLEHKTELSAECQAKVSEGKKRAMGAMMQRRQHQQQQQGQSQGKPVDDESDL